jgi:uncharacterized protein YggE
MAGQNGNGNGGITVTGEGRVSASPDQALARLGVSVVSKTLEDAREQAAATTSAIMDSLKANGVGDADMRTQHVNAGAEHDYTKAGKKRAGYRVENMLTVTVRGAVAASAVIDDAIAAGGDATQVHGISFTIEDPRPLEDQARKAAIADARRKAQTLASAGGVKLGKPVAIVEGNSASPIQPQHMRLAMETESTPMPIEGGEMDVRVHVTVTWAIEQS